MARVFPDRQIVPIKLDDSVLHVVFTIDEMTQIPGLRHIGWGDLRQLPPPQWRGIYDDDGRLMVGMNYNQDVGDSWEEADTPEYPEPMTAQGYKFAINYIVYRDDALTTRSGVPSRGLARATSMECALTVNSAIASVTAAAPTKIAGSSGA